MFYEPPDPFAPPYYEDLVKLKSRFPLWLWRRCNEAVRDPANGEPRFFGAKLIKVLSSATSDLGTYPTRPTTPIKTLKSIVELRSLLQNAQTRIAFQGGSQSWNPSYLDDLFSTLNVIINKRGLGKGGWETIRWEVYDKVSAFFCNRQHFCPHASVPQFSAILGGLQCREVGNGKYEWRDNARIWLDGNRVTTDIDFQQTRGLCASGLVYNDKLPVIPPTPAAVGDTLLNFRQE